MLNDGFAFLTLWKSVKMIKKEKNAVSIIKEITKKNPYSFFAEENNHIVLDGIKNNNGQLSHWGHLKKWNFPMPKRAKEEILNIGEGVADAERAYYGCQKDA